MTGLIFYADSARLGLHPHFPLSATSTFPQRKYGAARNYLQQRIRTRPVWNGQTAGFLLEMKFLLLATTRNKWIPTFHALQGPIADIDCLGCQ